MSSAMPTGAATASNSPISSTLAWRRPNFCGAADASRRTDYSAHTWQHAHPNDVAASAGRDAPARNRPDDVHGAAATHTCARRPLHGAAATHKYKRTQTPADAPPNADAPASDPASWRNWTPVSPYLAKDPRPDLSQGMSLKAVEEIEARAQEAQKYALEAESLSQQAQQASQEALAAIERKDRETVTEKCKEAERLAAEAKEVEEKCKAAYDACKKAREDARAMADAGDAEE